MRRFPKISDYPKSIYVRAETYKVIFKSTLPEDTLGWTDSGTHTISIKNGLSPRETFSTFVHELLHALEFEGNLKIKHKTVYKLEKMLVELYIDNDFLGGA